MPVCVESAPGGSHIHCSGNHLACKDTIWRLSSGLVMCLLCVFNCIVLLRDCSTIH
jgi:hypothetical protein